MVNSKGQWNVQNGPSIAISNSDLLHSFNHWDIYLSSGFHALELFINILRPRQNGRHFADDIFKCLFLNENIWIFLKISLKFVPKVRIINISALVQIMACRLVGAKPLSEPIMVSFVTRVCDTRPQWAKAEIADRAPMYCFISCRLVLNRK